MPDRITELYRLADLSTAILEDGGEFIHAMPYRAGFYNDERMALMYAIRARASTFEGPDQRLSRQIAATC